MIKVNKTSKTSTITFDSGTQFDTKNIETKTIRVFGLPIFRYIEDNTYDIEKVEFLKPSLTLRKVGFGNETKDNKNNPKQQG